MDLRFGGIQRLYGDGAFAKLKASHVCIVGLGGVGSWTVESLARTGVGALTLVDYDEICVSNTNRQLHAMQGEVGRLKSEVLKERLLKINPELEVNIVDEAYGLDTEELIFKHSYDGVVDAIDSSLTKFYLVLSCKKRKIPVVTVGSAGGRLNPTLIRAGDLSQSCEDTLLAILRKDLRRRAGFPRKGSMGVSCVYSVEKPKFIDAEGCVTNERSQGVNRPLDCTTGMGTVTHVTGSFGFMLSHLMVEKIINNSR